MKLRCLEVGISSAFRYRSATSLRKKPANTFTARTHHAAFSPVSAETIWSCLRRAAHSRGPNLTLWISPSEKVTGNAVLAKQLWLAAGLFSGNSDLESQGYCTTELGLVFLRFSVVRALDHS